MIFAVLLALAGILMLLFAWKGGKHVLIIPGVLAIAVAGIFVRPGFWSAVGILAAGTGVLFMLFSTSRKQAKTALAGGFLLFLAGMALFSFGGCGSGRKNKMLLENQYRFDDIQAEYLGEFVRKNYPGKTVGVIFSGKMTDEQGQEEEERFLKNFEKGLGAPVNQKKLFTTLDFSKVPETPEESEKLQQMHQKEFSARRYDEVFAGMNCGVILNFAGFPGEEREISRLESLKNEGEGFALILPWNSANQPKYLRAAIRSGAVGALVILNLDTPGIDKVPDDPAEAFQSRFLLLTKENIDRIADSEKYKYLLNPPETEQQH